MADPRPKDKSWYPECLRLRAAGMSKPKLAKHFGVSQWAILQCLGKDDNWSRNAKFMERRQEARKLYASGPYTVDDLALKFDVDDRTMRQWVKGVKSTYRARKPSYQDPESHIDRRSYPRTIRKIINRDAYAPAFASWLAGEISRDEMLQMIDAGVEQ